jgi:hypothetical protein
VKFGIILVLIEAHWDGKRAKIAKVKLKPEKLEE